MMPLLRMDGEMLEQTDWEAKAVNLLNAELKRQGFTYAYLAELIGDKSRALAKSCLTVRLTQLSSSIFGGN